MALNLNPNANASQDIDLQAFEVLPNQIGHWSVGRKQPWGEGTDLEPVRLTFLSNILIEEN